jgi:lipopolysaccharide/colanic/teichoic acid biosynthesis glycosyltransferase
VYVLLDPLLAGLPRGAVAPLVRPSEILQIGLTAIALGAVGVAVHTGHRWYVHLRSFEWWLGAVVVTSSFAPLAWMIARGLPVGRDDVTASLPFVKYAALYFVVRAAVRTEHDARLVIRFVLAGAVAISLIAFAQVAGVQPVIDLLSERFDSSSSGIVGEGRATTTIGSPIATGSYLAMACGLALSGALGFGRRSMLFLAVIFGVGTIASGQIGSIIGLAIVVAGVAHFHRRLARVIAVAVPLVLVALIGLWPVVAGRLAAIDPGTGLPASWIIRWTNVSELYWPLLADGGWILGVGPNAVVAPPDVWRERVFLESGYLWLLWVGGLPLLIAAVGFLATGWRDLRSPDVATGSAIDVARVTARASILMIAIITVLDPHLTMRAEADLFFTLLAVGSAAVPLVVGVRRPYSVWHELLGWPQQPAGPAITPEFRRARLQIAEAPHDDAELQPELTDLIETQLALSVRTDERKCGEATLVLCRHGSRLHGFVTTVHSEDRAASALVWRAIALCANSLRLDSLQGTTSVGADRSELRLAGRLAESVEIRRSDSATLEHTPIDGERRSDVGDHPPVRLVVGTQRPRWKRTADIALGAICLFVSAPLWAIAALSIRLSSPGPVLFRQVRVGAGGLPFQLYKFRTMYVDNDDSDHRESNRRELLEGAEPTKLDDDRRVTAPGRWLRRLSLDELPQLLNVLRSEMSLVGPRPSLLWEVELFEPSRRRRLSVYPGMTGPWQVSGRADLSMTAMLDLDVAYVETASPTVDLHCLVGTAKTVLTGRGAR